MIYYATRRDYDPETKWFTKTFAPKTRYGRFWRVGNNQFAGAALSLADWLREIRQASGGNGVLTYVHGFNTPMINSVNATDKLARGLRGAGFGGAVVGYHWPSLGRPVLATWGDVKSEFAYFEDRKMATRAATPLIEDCLWPLLREAGTGPTHLIAHSMGAYLVSQAFQRKAGDGAGWAAAGDLAEIVFKAADVYRNWWSAGNPGIAPISARCHRITNHYSIKDEVLDISWKVFNDFRKRAGQHGAKSDAGGKLFDVDGAPFYQNRYPPPKHTPRKSHNWHFEQKPFLRDLAKTLSGVPAKDMPTRVAGPGGDQTLKV